MNYPVLLCMSNSEDHTRLYGNEAVCRTAPATPGLLKKKNVLDFAPFNLLVQKVLIEEALTVWYSAVLVIFCVCKVHLVTLCES